MMLSAEGGPEPNRNQSRRCGVSELRYTVEEDMIVINAAHPAAVTSSAGSQSPDQAGLSR